MGSVPASPPTYEEARARLAAAGQAHVLGFWPQLSDAERAQLLGDVAELDLELVARLARGDGIWDAADLPYDRLEAPEVWRLGRDGPGGIARAQAQGAGEALLRAGKVACIVVAGGQGTRLGFPGPKGTLPVGPVSGKTLFAIHAAKINALERRHGAAIPFLVMTSEQNDADTRRYFELNAHFGLREVRFFTQGSLPAVDDAGKIFLAAKHRIARSPNGHGGTIAALARSGLLAELRGRGLTTLFYFQVDNPLVKVAEPFFLGAHECARAEYSLKILRKRAPDEKLGVVARTGATYLVVEYSDLPARLRDARDATGELLFWAGSPAIHVFALEFLARIGDGTHAMPYHRARKKIPHVDPATGAQVTPAKENGTKFESFIFDAMPFAQRALVVEGVREEEFGPVKNKTGEDSLESAQRMLVALHRQWLAARGVPAQEADRPCEIHPTFALGPEDLPADIAARLPKKGPVYFE
jgi:UDP-N-acetylglucosamine/UDP-N-acetylgalactosamine diphosphorylase